MTDENKTPLKENETVKEEVSAEAGAAAEEMEKKTDEQPKKKHMTKQERAAAKLEKKKKAEEKKKNNKNRPKDIKKATLRLLSYLKPFKGRIVIALLFAMLSTALGAGASLLLEPIFDNLNNAITGVADKSTAITSIHNSLLVLILIYILSGAMSFAYNKIMMHVTQRTLNSLRRDLFDHLQNLPLSFFDTHKTGEIMSRFNGDVESVSNLVSSSFLSIISAVITLIFDLVIMIVYSPIITVTLAGTLVLMLLVILIISAQSSRLFKKQHKIMGEFNGYVEEHVRGQRVVKVFNHEETVKQGYADINDNLRRTSAKANVVSGLMSPILSLIARINYAISVGFGAFLVIRTLAGNPIRFCSLSVGRLIVYIQYSKSFGSPIAQIAGQINTLYSALAGAERIFEVIDTEPETDDGKTTLVRIVRDSMGEPQQTSDGTGEWNWKVPQNDGSFRYIPVKGNVKFENVSFHYVEGEEVLKNISLEAKAGEKLAFVGSTGAGKTTITNLINRFYDIQEGTITYDGLNVRDIKKDDLRRSLSMVLQDTRLFAGTIEDNIRYGRLDATHEQIVEAAKIANAHSFIEKLPNGYDTQLKTDGQNISAGQRQLISIARAAVADLPVLILDEATSSVDTRTERLIEVGMDQLMQGRTVFVIAHRLSTVRNSDDIIVLEHGEIIEEGDHRGLLEQEGKYYQLYTGQFKLS